jgi:exonuclease VII large subunit
MIESIGIGARRSSLQAHNRLADIEQRIALLEPARLLARGWSITRSTDGVLIVDPHDVETGARIVTTVAGGRIASVVQDDEEVGRG